MSLGSKQAMQLTATREGGTEGGLLAKVKVITWNRKSTCVGQGGSSYAFSHVSARHLFFFII